MIYALRLNYIVQGALQSGPFETLEEAALDLAATGLKKKALRRCHVAVYEAEGAIILVATAECPTCSDGEGDGDTQPVVGIGS